MTSEEITLSDVILDIAAGPFGSNLKVSCFVDDGFPIIDGANLKGFKVTDNVTKFVTEEKARSLHRAIAKRGDVVVTISGTLGQIAYIPEDSQYEEYLVSQRQFRVTFDESKVCIPYIVYYFHSFEGQHKILMFANQVGVPALAQPLKNFRQIKMNLPPLDVQRRIAAVLKPLDDKIEMNARINARLERVAQALFKRQFVRFEPYGGTMPPGWREGTLSEIGTIVGGGTPSKKHPEFYTSNGIAWITPKDLSINKSKFINHGETDITELGLRKSSATLMPSGTVLFSSRAPIGYIAIADGEVTTNQGFKSVVPKHEIGTAYVYFTLKEKLKVIEGMASGTTFMEISGKAMKEVPIVIPSKESLMRLEHFCSPIFKMQKQLETQSRTLARLRDVLLPRLMSGAVDVGQVNLNSMQKGGSR